MPKHEITTENVIYIQDCIKPTFFKQQNGRDKNMHDNIQGNSSINRLFLCSMTVSTSELMNYASMFSSLVVYFSSS